MMHLGTVRTILAKELREVLRDRRTLMLMVAIPVFLYPALFVLMEQVVLFGRGNLEQQPVRVAVEQPLGAPSVIPLANSEEMQLYPFPRVGPGAVRSGRFDAVVSVDPVGDPDGRVVEVRVLYDGARERSLHARSLLLAELEALNEVTLIERLEQRGLPRDFAQPVAVRDSSVATARNLGGAALGRILPMVLVIMTVLGAFHPAIDIAAGERERRTLEPLLATSASSRSIVIGKYLAVAVISFTAAALNLGSMMLTLRAGVFQFAGELGLEFQLPLRAVFLILLLLALLALLFSALFLGIAVHARSFREAQTSLTPVYVLGFLPAIITMAPGIRFSVGIAALPIAGPAMLFRALMVGDAVGLEGVVAVVSTMGYAGLALAFASRSFSREDVLLGGDEDAEVRAARRPWWNQEGSSVPAPLTALLFVALVGLLYFHFGVGFARWGERGLLASQWLLLALPTAILVYSGRFRVHETLALRAAPPRSYAAALLIILGGLPLGWFIVWLQTFFLALPDGLVSTMQGLLTADDLGRVLWLLLVVAVTPALCEEAVFRGVLLQGLVRRIPVHLAILLSSFVFGAFHLSFQTAIRLLPTMFLGVLLAIVVVRTRSILPSMMMHFVNNATAVLLVSSPQLQRFVLSEDGGPNWALVAGGVVLLAAGLRLLPRGAGADAGNGGTP